MPKAKRILKITGIFIAMLLFIGSGIQGYLHNRSKLVSYDYDYMTGVITFTIDDNFLLFSATNETGNARISPHSSETKKVFCSLWDMPTSKNDRIHFVIRGNSGKEYRFSYELNHGKRSYIEMCDYPYAKGRMIRTYLDCGCIVHK